MPCVQVSPGATPLYLGVHSFSSGPHATEEDCLNACKEGACCNGTTCAIRPKCECDAFGYTFKGFGTKCSPNPCQDLCLCSNPATQNCTFTASIGGLTLVQSCNSAATLVTAQDLIDQPGVYGLGASCSSPAFYGRYASFRRVSDCPAALPETGTISGDIAGAGSNIGLVSPLGCDLRNDTSGPAVKYHLRLFVMTKRNTLDAGGQPQTPQKKWFYLVSANGASVSASVVWEGNAGIGSAYDGVPRFDRCLPCNQSWTAVTNDNLLFTDTPKFCPVGSTNAVPACPSDITLETPTLTIACPP